MNIELLFFLLLRFIHPIPSEPIELLVPTVETTVETEVEAPAYIHLETGETIYLEEGQDGTDVSMADLF